MMTPMRKDPLTAALALSVILGSSAARAESGVYCTGADIVEVFPGATGCEEADYVVLNLHRDRGDVDVQIYLRDACHTAVDYYSYVGQGLDAGDNGTLLAATASAAEVFGITPDVLLEDGTVLGRAGGTVDVCWDRVRFGPNRSVPVPEDGQALTWSGSAWRSAEPRPINANGDMGTFSGCGLADGGVSDPVEPLLCPEPEPSPEATPEEPEQEPEPSPSPETDGSVDPEPVVEPGVDPAQPEPDDDAAAEEPEPQPSPNEPEPNEPDPGGVEPESGSNRDGGTRQDAGQSGGGMGLAGVTDGDSAGCGCTLASRQKPAAWLMLGLPLLAAWRRRHRPQARRQRRS